MTAGTARPFFSEDTVEQGLVQVADGPLALDVLARIERMSDAFIPLIAGMSDTEVIAARKFANALKEQSWRIELACDAELFSRAERLKGGKGQKDHAGVGRMALARAIAAEVGVSAGTVLRNQQIQQTFGEQLGHYADVLPEKGYWEALLRTGDPQRYLAEFVREREHNPGWSTYDAANLAKAVKGGADEWYTPGWLTALARQLLGWIDLDPASSELANRTVGAATFYDRTHDGLTLPWFGQVWLNPPFSAIPAWLEKLTGEYARANLTAALVLLPATPDSRWWATVAVHPACFLKRRVAYEAPAGENGSARFSTVVVYLGTDYDGFDRTFAPHGWIYYPSVSAAA